VILSEEFLPGILVGCISARQLGCSLCYLDRKKNFQPSVEQLITKPSCRVPIASRVAIEK
jgi:hypothetical protein